MFIKNCHSLFLFITKPFHILKKYPVLYHGKNINIVNFGVFAALDGMTILLVFYWVMYSYLGYLSPSFIILTILAPLFVWGGAKLYFFGALGKKFIHNPVKYLVQTGFYVQGGIVGAFIWGLIASNSLNLSFFLIADALCLGTFLGQFFGRLGCFNYGCCYGKQSHDGCGLCYHNHESKVLRIHPELQDVNLYPTQLYEAMMNLVMFVIMLIVYTASNRLGLTTVIFFAYQGIVRIVLEIFRGDIYYNSKRNWFTFYASLVSVVIGIILYLSGPLFEQAFFRPVNGYSSLSLSNLSSLIYNNPVVALILLLAGTFLFVGYGFHGKDIGKFPNIKEVIKKHSYGRGESL